MDRTDEFIKLGDIYRSSSSGGPPERKAVSLSAFTMSALNIAANLEQNEALLKKMQRLTAQKEFSNDPALAIEEISTVFNTSIGSIKSEIGFLKREAEKESKAGHNGLHKKIILEFLVRSMTAQAESFQASIKTHQSHVEVRNKRVEKYGTGSSGISAGPSARMSAGLETGKYALFGGNREESAAVESRFNLELRNRRMGLLSRQMDHIEETTKVVATATTTPEDFAGIGEADGSDPPAVSHLSDVPPVPAAAPSLLVDPDDDKYNKKLKTAAAATGSVGGSAASGSYGRSSGLAPSAAAALHSRPSASSSSSSTANSRYRPAASFGNSSSSSGASQQQQQFATVKDTSRVRAAERVEASIAQMGQMFAQIASLVSEQSEVIGRIEDDVEAGLSETKQANESMQQLYNITKGNRGMIIKIFGLLLFFVVLFLYWT